jgi:DNA-binding beta-propeller fold protein YncE
MVGIQASFNSNEVKRYNGKTGAFLGTFVAAGAGGLNGPTGLAFGPDGNLYVSSNATDEVLRYNGKTGAFIDTFITASDADSLIEPAFLTFTP